MRLLDLFCGAGGAAVGYDRAGFRVVGIDIEPQPRYPFDFLQGDAMEWVQRMAHAFDAIHASPPCQAYSATKVLNKKAYPAMIEPLRIILKETGKPYVIENVPGAPLINPVRLNGFLFDMNTDRERWFECNFDVPLVLLPQSARRPVKMG